MLARYDAVREIVASRRISAFSAVCALTILGCGSGNIPTYPVVGTVKFKDGAPLAGGTVSFRSSDNSEHLTARGEIDENGEFTLTTFEPGDGAVSGRHQAIVTPPIQRAPRGGGWEAPPTMPKINRRFSSFDTSGLEFEVSDSAASNRFDIVVTKPDR
jgi:hypothetical protein